MLERLKEARIEVDKDKWKFHIQKIKFLDILISTEGIKIDPQKVSTILDWSYTFT